MAHFVYGQRQGLEIKFAHIDRRFTARATTPFDQTYMKALFDYGYRAGLDRAAFAADPLGAPEASSVAHR